MKSFLLSIVMILMITFATQSQSIAGTYSNKWEAASGEGIEYALTLKDDSKFIFISIRTYQDDIPEKVVRASGKWSLNGQLLTLNTTSGEDSENILESNLNKNKARYNSISPRNPKFNMVKPSLKFYESNVFYAKDMELFKTELSLTTSE